MAKLKLAAQEKLQLVLESLKTDVNASVLCRQHDIWPTQLNCLKQKALKGALEALSSRNGKKDAEKEALKSELQHLKEVIASQASEIVLFKKDELGLLGPIKGKRLPVMVKYELLNTINSSRLTKIQACKVLGLNLKRFYFWQSLYTVFGLDGLIDRPPKPQNIVNHLLPEEKNHR